MSASDIDNKMHIFPHNYIYEIINPDNGNFIGYSGEGELVVTMLNKGGKPLIRYRTGDMVCISNNSNSSIIRTPEIQIMGRHKDRIILNGSGYKASQIEIAIMKHVDRCLGYQLHIHNDGGVDSIDIQLTMFEKNVSKRSIINDIQKEFKINMNIDVNVSFIGELDAAFYGGALVSWKAAKIIDHRNSALEDIEKKSLKVALDKNFIRGE